MKIVDIKKMLETISPWPWSASECTLFIFDKDKNPMSDFANGLRIRRKEDSSLPQKENASFISQSPTIVADLVGRLEKAEKIIKNLLACSPDGCHCGKDSSYVCARCSGIQTLKEIGE